MQQPAILSTPCWTLTDGHAGNVRQARALAGALGVDSTDWTLQPRAPWRWWAPRRLAGDTQAFGPEFSRALIAPPSLAIGCGRQSALATRLLRERGSFSVQILDPRVDPSNWDLVIAPEHDGLHGPNVITLDGSLHPVDASWLSSARDAFASMQPADGPLLALLVGGDSAHARLDVAALDAIAEPLLDWSASERGRVWATASRRTSPAVRARLRERFGQAPHRVWDSTGDGPNPYAGLLAWADRIVCTADSVNMLSEACATDAPVYVAGIDALQGRPRRFVDRLLAIGRIRPLKDLATSFAFTPLRETPRVAKEVRSRLMVAGRYRE